MTEVFKTSKSRRVPEVSEEAEKDSQDKPGNVQEPPMVIPEWKYLTGIMSNQKFWLMAAAVMAKYAVDHVS
jgi:hypothetical protein